jgi:hypothetical protein
VAVSASVVAGARQSAGRYPRARWVLEVSPLPVVVAVVAQHQSPGAHEEQSHRPVHVRQDAAWDSRCEAALWQPSVAQFSLKADAPDVRGSLRVVWDWPAGEEQSALSRVAQ